MTKARRGESEFWRHRPVFVTGATGLLGSWLTEALLARGASVVALVRDLGPKSRLRQSGMESRVTVVRGAVEDGMVLERAINEYEIRTVFHLAAQTIVPIANRNPLSTFESNIRGAWNLLEACRRAPAVQQIVGASSDKAYGEQETLPYSESQPLQGRLPYDVSKSCADLIAQSYHRTFGTPVCVTRCGNFFGGGDLNFNRLVPGAIRSALHAEAPVIRSDGSLVRDYIYVRDGAEACLLLAEKMSADPAILGEAFNFSTEERSTVLQMTERILRLMGQGNLRPVVLNEARHEISKQYLSAAKARARLGWAPRYPLDAALTETIAWYREHFGRT